MKSPKCKYCGSELHYSFKCFKAPRKPIKQKTYKLSTLNLKSHTKPVSYRKQLILELDKVFSQYIRLRDSKKGIIKCITCGQYDKWQDADNCHFISRGKIGTRYNEINCNAGCQHCNRFLGGNLVKYEQWLKYTYGNDIINKLRIESRKTITTLELAELLDIYKKKLDNLIKTY